MSIFLVIIGEIFFTLIFLILPAYIFIEKMKKRKQIEDIDRKISKGFFKE